MTGAPALFLLAILAATLCAAAWSDIRSRTISNGLNGAIALMAPLWWWANGLSLWPGVAIQLALFATVFLIFLGLFVVGGMGGGDVKLLAAVALWLPLDPLLDMLFLMAIAGGVLTIVMMVIHRIGKSAGRPEIPYGVAIAIATIWVTGQRYLYHFA